LVGFFLLRCELVYCLLRLFIYFWVGSFPSAAGGKKQKRRRLEFLESGRRGVRVSLCFWGCVPAVEKVSLLACFSLRCFVFILGSDSFGDKFHVFGNGSFSHSLMVMMMAWTRTDGAEIAGVVVCFLCLEKELLIS
jgi:hypothetical protein